MDTSLLTDPETIRKEYGFGINQESGKDEADLIRSQFGYPSSGDLTASDLATAGAFETPEERNFLQRMADNFRRGRQDMKLDQRMGAAVVTNNTDQFTALKSERDTYQKAYQVDPIEADNIVERAFLDASRMMYGMTQSFVTKMTGAAIGAGVALLAGQLGPQVAALEEIVTVPMAAYWGWRTGGLIGGMAPWYLQGVGMQYNEMREKGFDHNAARIAAMASAGPYAAVEFINEFIPLKFMAPGMIAKMRPLLAKTAGQIAARIGTQYAKNVIGEVAEEGIQQGIMEATDYLTAELKGREDLKPEAKEAMLNIWDATVSAIPPVAILGLPGAKFTAAREYKGMKFQKAMETLGFKDEAIRDISFNLGMGDPVVEKVKQTPEAYNTLAEYEAPREVYRIAAESEVPVEIAKAFQTGFEESGMLGGIEKVKELGTFLNNVTAEKPAEGVVAKEQKPAKVATGETLQTSQEKSIVQPTPINPNEPETLFVSAQHKGIHLETRIVPLTESVWTRQIMPIMGTTAYTYDTYRSEFPTHTHAALTQMPGGTWQVAGIGSKTFVEQPYRGKGGLHQQVQVFTSPEAVTQSLRPTGAFIGTPAKIRFEGDQAAVLNRVTARTPHAAPAAWMDKEGQYLAMPKIQRVGGVYLGRVNEPAISGTTERLFGWTGNQWERIGISPQKYRGPELQQHAKAFAAKFPTAYQPKAITLPSGELTVEREIPVAKTDRMPLGMQEPAKDVPTEIMETDKKSAWYKLWSRIQNAIPLFQGNKREVSEPSTKAIQNEWTPEEANRITTIDEYFGGGGGWGIFQALVNYRSANQINIHELDPERIEMIKFIHDRGNKLWDYLNSSGAINIIKGEWNRASSAGGIKSGGGLAGRLNTVINENQWDKKPLTPDQRVALKMIADLVTRGNMIKKTLEETIGAVQNEQTTPAYEAAQQFIKIHGNGNRDSIRYIQGDSYAVQPTAGSHVLSIVDPPYVFTTGYDKKSLVGTDIYAKTADLNERLIKAGNNVLYTDSAWWLPDTAKLPKAATASERADILTERKLKKALPESEKSRATAILAQQQAMFPKFKVMEKLIGGHRYEVLGLHNAFLAERPAGATTTPTPTVTPEQKAVENERLRQEKEANLPYKTGAKVEYTVSKNRTKLHYGRVKSVLVGQAGNVLVQIQKEGDKGVLGDIIEIDGDLVFLDRREERRKAAQEKAVATKAARKGELEGLPAEQQAKLKADSEKFDDLLSFSGKLFDQEAGMDESRAGAVMNEARAYALKTLEPETEQTEEIAKSYTARARMLPKLIEWMKVNDYAGWESAVNSGLIEADEWYKTGSETVNAIAMQSGDTMMIRGKPVTVTEATEKSIHLSNDQILLMEDPDANVRIDKGTYKSVEPPAGEELRMSRIAQISERGRGTLTDAEVVKTVADNEGLAIAIAADYQGTPEDKNQTALYGLNVAATTFNAARDGDLYQFLRNGIRSALSTEYRGMSAEARRTEESLQRLSTGEEAEEMVQAVPDWNTLTADQQTQVNDISKDFHDFAKDLDRTGAAILWGMAQGQTNREMAQAASVSEPAISQRKAPLMAKLKTWLTDRGYTGNELDIFSKQQERAQFVKGNIGQNLEPAGVTVAAVQHVIQTHTRGWKGMPNLTVLPNYTEAVKGMSPAAMLSVMAVRPRGFYLNGKVYIISSALESADEAVEVMLHEAIGHYGLRQVLGDKFQSEMEKLYHDIPTEGIKEIMDIYRDQLPQKGVDPLASAKNRAFIAEEYAAREAARDPNGVWYKKLIEAIRRALNAILPVTYVNKLTRTGKLDSLLAESRAFVERGKMSDADQVREQMKMMVAAWQGEPRMAATERPLPQDTLGFYSQVERTVGAAPQERMPADQWMNWLTKQPGVKKEELDMLGIREWLADQKGAVNKADVLDFVRENNVQLTETEKGVAVGYISDWNLPINAQVAVDEFKSEDISLDELNERLGGMGLQAGIENGEFIGVQRKTPEAKFATYQTPGGENYREVLLTLPYETKFDPSLVRIERSVTSAGIKKVTAFYNGKEVVDFTAEPSQLDSYFIEQVRQLYEGGYADTLRRDAGEFISSHWAEPNVLAHVRMNDRTDADGKKVLFIEEVQSDWHQQGREKGYIGTSRPKNIFQRGPKWYGRYGTVEATHGYATREEAQTAINAMPENYVTSNIPDTPFKSSWPMLAMKRMIRFAAENGYDRIAWTTGEMQAERYDLSKQVKHIAWEKNDNGTFNINAPLPNGQPGIYKEDLTLEQVKELVGKDISKKIEAGEGRNVESETGYRDWTLIEGENLKVGGEGMKGFYDQILPSEVNKYIKKWGARVGETKIEVADRFNIESPEGQTVNEFPFRTREEAEREKDEGDKVIPTGRPTTVHSLSITPAMRESVLQGQPMFAMRKPRANPMLTPEGRDKFFRVEQSYKPDRKSREMLLAEVSPEITEKGAKNIIIEIAAGKLGNTAQEVVKAQEVLNAAEFTKLLTGSESEQELAIYGMRTYLEEGTEQGRAFRMRQDRMETPAQRMNAIAKILATPGDAVMEKWTSMTDQERKLAVTEQRIKMQATIASLKRMGITDIGSIPVDILMNDQKFQEIVHKIAEEQSTTGDRIYEYWRNSILSGLLTPIVNMTGNLSFGTWEVFVQKPAEALLNIFTKTDAPTMTSVKEMWKHMWPSITKANLAFQHSFNYEVSTSNPKLDIKGSTAIPGKWGRVIRIPQRLMLSTDEWFKAILWDALAAEHATRMADHSKLIGQDRQDFIQASLEKKDSLSRELGMEEARRLLFQTKPGTLGSSLLTARRQRGATGWAFKYLFPFVTTPVNLIKLGVQKSPLGVLRFGFEGITKMATGKSAYTEKPELLLRHIAEQMFAWTFAGILYGLTAPGDDDDELPWITGTIAGTPNERRFKQRNVPPMSIRIGDKWYSYTRVEPLSTALALMVNAINEVRDWKNGKPLNADFIKNAAQLITDRTYLQGVGDIWKAIEDPDRWVDMAANQTASWFPNLFRQLMRATDPYVRDYKVRGKGLEWLYESYVERGLQKMFPIAAIQPQPKYDHWGRAISKDAFSAENTTGLSESDVIWRMLVPVRVQDANSTSNIDRMIFNWNRAQNSPETQWWPGTPRPEMTIKGRKFVMNDQQFEHYLINRGQFALHFTSAVRWNYNDPSPMAMAGLKRIFERSGELARRRALTEIITEARKQQTLKQP